jgi:hypothetical protein
MISLRKPLFVVMSFPWKPNAEVISFAYDKQKMASVNSTVLEVSFMVSHIAEEGYF